mgnify:CR=1 FL=1
MALVLNGSNDTITGLQINSTNIVDGSIVNADINASAAIASTKISGSLGKIVKYVTTESQSTTKTTSGQGNAKIELTSLSITPASSSNKVLILVSACVYVYGSSNAFSGLRVHRGDINSGTNIFNQFGGSAASSNNYSPWAYNFVDTPNTDQAQLYTVSIFRSSGNTNYVTTDGMSYTLTLIELEP